MLVLLLLAATPPSPAQPVQRVTVCLADGGSCGAISGGGGGGSSGGLTDAELRASPLKVYVVDAGAPLNINPPASLPLPTGAATSAKQDTGNTSLGSIDGKLPALVSSRVPVDPSGVTSPVSAASLPLPSGASTEATLALIKAKTDNLDVALSTRTKPADQQHVIVDSAPTTAVTGTFWQATQPVSLASVPSHAVTGPLTNTELRAAVVPVFVDGGQVAITNFPATQAVTGTFWQATQPVSGTFWQATQPVSGTVTANAGTGTMAVSGPLTDTQLRASAVPVSLASTTITGTVAATQSGTWSDRIVGNAGVALDGPVGSTPPANALLQGLRETTNMVAQVQCDKSASANIASATHTQLVALSGSTVIYVCSAYIEIQGVATTAGTLQLEYGTGSSCGTGTTAITPTFIGSTTAGNPTVIPMSAGAGYLFKTTAGQALCALSTTTTVQKVFITYAQF